MFPINLIHWLSGAFNPPILLSFILLPPSNNEGISYSLQPQILHYPSFQWREAYQKRGFPYIPYRSHNKAIQISGMWSVILLYTKGFVVSICWSQLRLILYAPFLIVPAVILEGDKQCRTSQDLPPPPGRRPGDNDFADTSPVHALVSSSVQDEWRFLHSL